MTEEAQGSAYQSKTYGKYFLQFANSIASDTASVEDWCVSSALRLPRMSVLS